MKKLLFLLFIYAFATVNGRESVRTLISQYPSPTNQEYQEKSAQPLFVCTPFDGYRPPIDQTHGLGAWTGYLYGEFLCWRTVTGELDYIVTGSPSSFPDDVVMKLVAISQVGQLRSVEYDWHPAFRIGIGMRFPPDAWELTGNYLYFHNAGSDSYSRNQNAIDLMVGTFRDETGDELTEANSQVELNLHLPNLLLGKRVLFSDRIIVFLYTGATGLWLDQDWTIHYAPGLNIGNINKTTSDWRFSGGGIRFGLNTDWYIGKGFSLLSHLSGALYYGFYENNLKAVVTGTEGSFTLIPGKSATIQDTHFSDNRIAPHLKLALGPAWGIMRGNFGVEIYALYELNAFFNLNYVYRAFYLDTENVPVLQPNQIFSNSKLSDHSNSILAMQGLTAGVRFNF